MSRNTSPARHRAAVDGSIALQGLSRAARAHASTIGRPVAIAAVTSGIALSAMGTAHAGTYSEQGTTAAAGATSHTVVAGDTLGAISARYGVDLNAVLSVNGLSVTSIIVPGQNIALPTAGAVAAPVQTVSVPVAVAPAAPVVQQVAATTPAAATIPAPAVQQVAVTTPAAAPAVQQVTVDATGSYTAPAAVSYGAAAVAADYQLTSTGVDTRGGNSKPVVSAPAGDLGGIILGSAQAQLAAGAIQDCTVLAEVALRAAGIQAGDLAPSQFFQFGSTVSTPAPGDLVITGGHVAIYAGGGQVISSGMNGARLTMQHPLSDLPGASFVRVSR